MLFSQLAEKLKKRPIPDRLLAYDPGNLTGWALFEKAQYIKSGQISTPPGDYVGLHKHLKCHLEFKPTVVVIENYIIYKNSLDIHANLELWVPKVIGVMHFFFSELAGVSVNLQLASEVKKFCTDEKLKAWGMYNKAEKHANDAVRHACANILFKK